MASVSHFHSVDNNFVICRPSLCLFCQLEGFQAFLFHVCDRSRCIFVICLLMRRMHEAMHRANVAAYAKAVHQLIRSQNYATSTVYAGRVRKYDSTTYDVLIIVCFMGAVLKLLKTYVKSRCNTSL